VILFDATSRPASAEPQRDPSHALPLNSSRAGALARALSEFAGWLPLLAAFAFFSHLCWYGLRPALAERARMDRVHVELVNQHTALDQEAADLARAERALGDPIYQERIRRRLLHAGTARLVDAPSAGGPGH
jgi:hypothetical protein